MKKAKLTIALQSVIGFVAVLGLLIAAVNANANVYTFQPTDKDLADLDHYKYYTWGIQWTLPTNESITEAVLKINNIDDWENEANDHLYIHLLDNPQAGTVIGTDNQGGGDYFASNGPLVANYQDPGPGKVNLTYTFSTLGLIDELESYASNGVFGFGFDPDCHYYNDGVSFCVTTKPSVPEPSTVWTLLSGAVAFGFGYRRLVKQ